MTKSFRCGVLVMTGLACVVTAGACTSESSSPAPFDAGLCTEGCGFDGNFPSDSASPPNDAATPRDSATPDALADTSAPDSAKTPDGGVIIGCIPQEVSTRYDATWVFGHGCRADWNAQNQVTFAASAILFSGFEGTIAAANASTGALFATSDGIDLFDGTGTKTNTAPLGGNTSAAQPVAFIGKPGSTSDFYIVANAAASGDAAPAGLYLTTLPCGQLVPSGAPSLIAGTEMFTEALATVRHANNVDRWILGVAPTGIGILPVTAAGVGAPVIAPWGSTLTNVTALQRAFISFARDRRTFAITAEGQGLVVGSFDNALGTVSGLTKIELPSTTSLYSAAFSPDGSKLYASEWSGQYFQVDLAVLATLDGGADAGAAVTTLGTSGGALRLAIDDKMYLTKYSGTALTVISNPNAAAPLLQTGTVNLPTGCSATYGFPGVGDL